MVLRLVKKGDSIVETLLNTDSIQMNQVNNKHLSTKYKRC